MVDMQRCENLLFNHETTYRTDFRFGEIEGPIKTIFKAKPKKPIPETIPLKDIQALFPLRDPNIPFNMYHKHNPIVRGNPWVEQKKYLRPPDRRRVEVQATRPRVHMTPALPMDDIEEPARHTLVDFIYKSTVRKALDEAVDLTVKKNQVIAPLLGKYAHSRPIMLEPLQFPRVPPEWRIPSFSWDRRQLRAHTEPTKRFWLARTPDCRACRETATELAHRKLMCQINTQT